MTKTPKWCIRNADGEYFTVSLTRTGVVAGFTPHRVYAYTYDRPDAERIAARVGGKPEEY